MTGDTQSTQAELSWFTPGLQEIMAVPFSPNTTENDTAALLAWMDFTETIASTGTSCIFGTDCPSGICDNGVCQEHDNPELRGIGATPLGKSLFYAGEYLRHFVLVEGQPCGTDSDCGSPNHTCVEGACHDPYAECRPTSIILFTDGIETVNDNLATFFHPRVQAKRLHFGLGCSSDADCLNEATCVSGICEPPAWLGLPEKQCNSITMACDSNADCPDFNCGKSLPCPGKCETTAIGVTSPAANHIKDYQGNPLPITIHVVDASGYANGNALIATYGGGEHVSVAFDDLDQLVSQLTTLFDTKDDSPCGSSANGSP
jgi:hypothetical protein